MVLLPDAGRILEIGCGTGEDALQFAERGFHVVATDNSTAMLQVTRRKLINARETVRDRVQVEMLDASDPGSANLLFEQDFDLVFSNFGALNCVSDLRPMLDYAHNHLKPNGYVAFTIMGRFCAWEILGFAARADLRRVRRRWSGQSEWSVNGLKQDVWFPSVRAIKRIARPKFMPVAVYGIGALLPTSEFFGACERWPTLFRQLVRVERVLAPFWPVNRISDHFLIVLQRCESMTNK